MTWSSWYYDNATRWWWRPWYPRWARRSRTWSVHRRRRRWRRRRVRRQRQWRPRTAYAAPDTVIEYVAPAGTCAAPAPVSEFAPTAADAANEAGCDEDASPKSTYRPLEIIHTDLAASNASSMATVELGQETSDGEDSESDAPYTPELDNVFDALVELAGGYGRDWVPVRQIQAQTSLQRKRLEELLEEWEFMGVICRDDTRLEVAFCLSVTDALEDENWRSSVMHKSRSAARLEGNRDRHGLGARRHKRLACPCLTVRAVQRVLAFFLNGMAPEQRWHAQFERFFELLENQSSAGPTADVSSIAASLSLSPSCPAKSTPWTAVPRTIQKGLARLLRKDDKYNSRFIGTIWKFFFLSKSNSQWSRQVPSGPLVHPPVWGARMPELVQPAGADWRSLRALRGPCCK